MNTDRQVLDRAIELFTSSKAWPTEPVDELIRQTHARRSNLCELDYLAFQSTNFAIMNTCNGEWPPMSPPSFARQALSDPRMQGMFPKFIDFIRGQI